MNRRYEIAGQQATCSSTAKTALTLISSTSGRPCVIEFALGSSATPADLALLWLLQRFTAAGTAGSSVTPHAKNPSDTWTPAATAGENHSTEPTYTSGALLFKMALNLKATLLWQAMPGNEIWLPATANNGVGIRASNASHTGAFDGRMSFVD